MIIYIDDNDRCHVTNPEGLYKPVETNFFDGMCPAYIEGYLVKDGGKCIAPWRDYNLLCEFQAQYEAQLTAAAAAYAEGVNSV